MTIDFTEEELSYMKKVDKMMTNSEYEFVLEWNFSKQTPAWLKSLMQNFAPIKHRRY